MKVIPRHQHSRTLRLAKLTIARQSALSCTPSSPALLPFTTNSRGRGLLTKCSKLNTYSLPTGIQLERLRSVLLCWQRDCQASSVTISLRGGLNGECVFNNHAVEKGKRSCCETIIGYGCCA